MFINCPSCRALVATDPATDLPPERCPRCAVKLRGDAAAPAAAGDARTAVASAIAEVHDGQGLAQDDPVSRPAVSIATLLQAGVQAGPDATAPTMARESLSPDAGDALPPAAFAASAASVATMEAAGPGATRPEPQGAVDADTVTRADAPGLEAGVVPGASTGPDASAVPDASAGDPDASAVPDASGDLDAPALPDASGDLDASAVPDASPGPHAAAVPSAPSGPVAAASGDPAAGAGDPVIPAPPTGAAQAAPRPASRSAPSFARRRLRAADGSGRRWPIPAAIAGLSLLLALQWLLADRARLAADPAWRPVVAAACGVLRCSLPPWREPAAFTLLERDVRAHPGADGALRITASFRNDAAWAQPWPEVVLTLSDIDGRPLGMRAFTVDEYLDGAPPSGLIASGQGAMIRMDVLEPGPGAVGFTFDFR